MKAFYMNGIASHHGGNSLSDRNDKGYRESDASTVTLGLLTW